MSGFNATPQILYIFHVHIDCKKWKTMALVYSPMETFLYQIVLRQSAISKVSLCQCLPLGRH
jgi:hypothetical protein